MSIDLSNASAIVTGGASGLGLATTQMLLETGPHVVVMDLPDHKDSTTREDVIAALGERAHFSPGNVTDPSAVAAAVELATSFGPLRVAVNCAGVATPGKLVGRSGPLDYEMLMKVMAINLGGSVNVMSHAAAAMKANALCGGDRGVLVNTASVAAYDGQIGQIAYAASKGGVVSLTLPAARELASSQIRVVTIAPGLFETPMMGGLPDSAREALASKTPHPARLGRAEDYGLLVRQIVENPMLNGEVIRLDGAVRLEPK